MEQLNRQHDQTLLHNHPLADVGPLLSSGWHPGFHLATATNLTTPGNGAIAETAQLTAISQNSP
jgi:hypothetical protein